MTHEEEPDARVRRLLAEGTVSATAVAHARAVALRGHSSASIAELLVELEHLAPEDLADVPVDAAPAAPSRAAAALASPGEPDHIVRLVNAFLLTTTRLGSAFRVEAGEVAAVRTSERSRFDQVVQMQRGTEVARRMIARLREMAGIDDDAPQAQGHILVHTGRADLAFRLDVEPTDVGPRAIVQRHTAWHGHGPPDSAAWDGYRRALETARRATRNASSAWRAVVREAEAIGNEATIEHVIATAQLATARSDEGDDAGAAALAAEAFARAETLAPGVRALGSLCAHAASMESADLARRAALFDRAEAWLASPGPGRGRTAAVLIDRAIIERVRSGHHAARETAERAYADERAWFDATTPLAVRALVESALASAAMGDAARAEASAREATRAANALGTAQWESDWALGASLAPSREGITLLVRALERRPATEREEDAPFVALTLARACLAAGQPAEAAAVARRVNRFVGIAHAARTELEAIAARPPYR